MYKNSTTKADLLRSLNVGERTTWFQETETVQRDMKYLLSTARSVHIKVATRKALLVIENELPIPVVLVERTA